VNGLPKGWRTAKLGRVLELQYGKSLPEKSRRPGRVRVFGSNGPIGVHNEPLTSGTTIVVGRKGSIGEVHLSYEPCFPIDTTYYVDSFDFVTPEFAAGLLRSLGLQNMDRASAIPGLNRNEVYELDVQIPPLPEQRKIVAKLDSLTGRTARVWEELGRIPMLIQKYREAILSAAVEGKFFATTSSRRSAPLAEHISWGPQNGIYLPQSRYGSGVPIVRIDDFQVGWIRPRQSLRLVTATDAEKATYGLRGGDIVINRVNSPSHLGKLFVVPEEFDSVIFESNMMRLRVGEGVLPEWVALYLTSPNGSNELKKNAKWAVNQASINQGDVLGVRIPVPSLEQQKNTLAAVNRAFIWLNRVATEHANASRLLPKLDQAILAKAFRGELVLPYGQPPTLADAES
jgi:type I restriction enzyme S subunit